MTCVGEAPAKINRELRVGRIREDGYHEILSRMVSIDLADRLTAEIADTLEFSCDDPTVPRDDRNLVVRAARGLAARAGVPPGARLHLQKRIPVGGGLGGGSADAGAALILLARLWRLEGAASWLAEVAAELGSDVPFFLTGGEAEVAGRGELVTPLEDGEPVDLLLIVPPFSISTAAVYRAFAGRGALPGRLEVAEPGRKRFLGPNDLTPAVLKVEPRMQAYLASAARLTDDHAISGSGSALVLRAPSEARAWLSERHPEARVLECRTISRDQYRHRTNPHGGAS